MRKQKGISMIEVLVALAILSIGLLGTAALQLQSKRANLGAVERTLASVLINDMFERMRANPSVFSAYVTQLAASQQIGTGTTSTPTTNCKTTDCTPSQLVTYDVWDWEQLLMGATEQTVSDVNTGGLVLPLACMTTTAAGGGEGLYTLAIAWRGNSELSTAAPSPNNCGLGSGLYDGDSGSDTLRRIIVLTAYLNDE